MKLAERIVERLLNNFKEYPPFTAFMAIDVLCHALPDNPAVEEALYAILRVLMHTFPSTFKVDEGEFLRQWKAWPEERYSMMSVPLYDVVNVPGLLVEIQYQICHELYKKGLLLDLRKQLRSNENDYHKITEYDRRKKRIPLPNEVDEPPEKLVSIYLKGTPFYDLFHAQVPFKIPRARWPAHAIAIAPSEWGKSELIGTFLREAIEDEDQRAIIVCDPHGQLFNKAILRVPPERLIAIDLTRNPPDLNILDRSVMSERSALDTFNFLMSSLAGSLSPKQQQSIKPLFALLNKIDGANLETLHEIITEQVKRPTKFKPQIEQLDRLHRVFFETLWYTGNYQDTKDALSWKVSAVLDDPTFHKMFTAPRNSMTISRWIEEKRIVLIKSADTLDEEGTRLFFLFVVAQYYAAAMRRDAIPESQHHLAMLFFDEASIVLQSPVIEKILTRIRKYNTSFFAATQLWEHVAKEVRPAILGSCGIRILGQLGHDEASALYRDQKVPLDTITNLHAVPRQYAQWCFFVRTVTPEGVVVKTPYGALEAMPQCVAADGLEPPLPEPKSVVLPLDDAASKTTLPQQETTPVQAPPSNLPVKLDTTTVAQSTDDVPTKGKRNRR